MSSAPLTLHVLAGRKISLLTATKRAITEAREIGNEVVRQGESRRLPTTGDTFRKQSKPQRRSEA